MENIFIGIDVSSKTLDICIKEESGNTFFTIENTISSCKKFFKKYKSNRSMTYVAMENTGRYNYNLNETLNKFSFLVYVINPTHLKKSLGLARGKNDQIDAERIAYFIKKNHMDLPQWKPDTLSVKQLKVLQSERRYRVKIKTGLLNQRRDYKLMKSMDLDKELLKLNKSMVENIDKQIKAIECKIDIIIEQDKALQNQSKRLRSIPGVGKVLTWMMISKTQGFTTIETPRKMACYAGVVPFEYQSGTSLRYRPKVSVFADKELKKVLHLAAMRIIQMDNEMSAYYHKKVTEGKNKMSVLNAIRNKIIHRIFAIIKNETFYKKDFVLS